MAAASARHGTTATAQHRPPSSALATAQHGTASRQPSRDGSGGKHAKRNQPMPPTRHLIFNVLGDRRGESIKSERRIFKNAIPTCAQVF